MRYVVIFIQVILLLLGSLGSLPSVIHSEELSKKSLELRWITTMRLAPGSGGSIDFSSDGDTMAYVRDDGSIWFLSLSQRKDIFCFNEMIADIGSIVFLPDGTTIASGSGDSVNKIWSLKSREMLRDFRYEHRMPRAETVGRIAVSPDGEILACPGSRSRKCPIEFWSVETGKLIKTIGDKDGYFANCLAFSPDGEVLTAVVKNEIRQWSVQTGERLDVSFASLENISSLEYSPDGKTLIAGGGNNIKGVVKFLNSETGEEMRTIIGHNMRVMSLAISRDGRYLLTGGLDKTFKLWSVNTGELLLTHSAHKGSIITVAFGFDNKTFATASSDGVIIVWSIE